MIGIIGAMELEVNRLRDAMEQKEESVYAGLRYDSGRLYGQEAVLCRCGPGKVNAALCAQAMIDRFAPDCIINSGVAGGVGEGVEVTDVVVASHVCQHDMDTTAVGDEPGYISGLGKVLIPCEPELVTRLALAASEAGDRVHRGVVATGDQFISSRGERERIRTLFDACAVEMEGGSIGHVCDLNGVPFAVLRVISDGGAEAAQMEYPVFCRAAADKSMEIIQRFLFY